MVTSRYVFKAVTSQLDKGYQGNSTFGMVNLGGSSQRYTTLMLTASLTCL
jgi:hypothetical protein